MLDNYPTLRFALRSLLAGVFVFIGYVQATGFDDMQSGDWFDAAAAGLLAALSFAGVSSVTPIDKSVGAGKGDTPAGDVRH